MFVNVPPKGGYISKAIRLYYSDLESMPSKDPLFRKAIHYAQRCFVKFGDPLTEVKEYQEGTREDDVFCENGPYVSSH